MPSASTESIQLIAAVVTFMLMSAWETVAPFRAFREGRVKHSGRNLSLGAINAVLGAVLFSAVTVSACVYVQTANFGVLSLVELPSLAAALTAFLVLDLWTYFWHRANHLIRFLWRFHRTHHSDRLMDVSTAVRFHTGEIAISNLLRVALILLFGLSLAAVLTYEAILRIATEFHHSNINLPAKLDALVRRLIVSPDMHKIHHSEQFFEMDSNYSSVLSIWDRLFRTYRDSTEKSSLRYGVPGLGEDRDQRLWGLLRTPLAPIRRAD